MDESSMRDEAIEALHARIAARLTELEQQPIGAPFIGALLAMTRASMDTTSAVRVTALWDRVVSFAHAQSMISCTEAVRGGDLPSFLSAEDATRIVAQELAAMTHVSFATAMNRTALVGQVGRQLPLSWEALDRGDLSLIHLKALANETRVCTPRVAIAVDARVVPEAIARGWTPSELGNAAARAIMAIDPEGAAERAKETKKEADVVLYPGSHESAAMVATGDAATMRRAMDAVHTRATQMGRDGDLRPIGQRRFDALAEFVLGKPTTERPVVEAVVTIDLTTLLGLTDRPGELSGYGPISAETARELAKDAMLRRLVTDPLTGTMIDLGHRRYRPSATLRRIIDATHRTCRFPGCSRRAIKCDCDHIKENGSGGHTSTDNLHPLCRMHHNLKTKKLWHVDVNLDGSETWTSPLGFVYQKRAATYPIDLFDPPDIDELPDCDLFDLRRSDPDPPIDDDLPEPPPITDAEYEAFSDAIERQCYAVANANYDSWRNLGLVS